MSMQNFVENGILTVFLLCVIDIQPEHVRTLDMVERSHIESEVKSVSINRKAITYLVGHDTLSLFLRCLIPKLKQVKTFDPVDMPGGHVEFLSNLLPPPEWPSQI